MSRPQYGFSASPWPYSRVLVYEVKDLPMTSMSVGQFSVWIPGLAHQIVQQNPGKTLNVIVGFGFMFWVLAWHGKRPTRFQMFEAVETDSACVEAAEGDLWVYISSDDPTLIEFLVGELNSNLGGLTRRPEDHSSASLTGGIPEKTVPGSIWIPESEPDFARGCFLLQLRLLHPPGNTPIMEQALDHFFREHTLDGQILPHVLALDTGTLVLLFHQDPGLLDSALEEELNGEESCFLSDAGVTEALGVRFFIPSLDVLTGLRQGGIRMNRFSPTQQWNQ